MEARRRQVVPRPGPAYAALNAGQVDGVDHRHADQPRPGGAVERRARGRRPVQDRRGVRRDLPQGQRQEGDLRPDHPGPGRRRHDQRADRQVPRRRPVDGAVHRRPAAPEPARDRAGCSIRPAGPTAGRPGPHLSVAPSIVALLFPPTGIPALVLLAAGRPAGQRGRDRGGRRSGRAGPRLGWYSVGDRPARRTSSLFLVLAASRPTTAACARCSSTGDAVSTARRGTRCSRASGSTSRCSSGPRSIVLVWALRRRHRPPAARQACAPIRFAGHGLHRRVPRRCPRCSSSTSSASACRRPSVPVARATSPTCSSPSWRSSLDVRRLRVGGVPGRHREHPLEPDRGGPLARPQSYVQTLRHVVVPQAVRRIIPPLLNDFIGLQKDTSLIGFIGDPRRDQPGPVRQQLARPRSPRYTMAALLFLAHHHPVHPLPRLPHQAAEASARRRGGSRWPSSRSTTCTRLRRQPRC